MRPALPLLALAACTGSGSPPVSSDETALTTYSTCAALESDLKDMLIQEVEAQFDQMRYWQTHPGPWLAEDTGGTAPPMTGAPRQEGKDYSGTNNQETGVDEADFVKTDGYHVYVLNGNRLHVFGVPQLGQLVPESVTEVEGWPTQMLVDKNSGKIAIFSQVNPTLLPLGHPLRDTIGRAVAGGLWVFRTTQVAKITILDGTDRHAPRLLRELYLEGSYQTARLVDGSVRVAGYTVLDIPALNPWYYGYGPGGVSLTLDEREAGAKAEVLKLTLADIVPRIYERLPDKTFSVYEMAKDGCTSFHRPTDSRGRGVTSILTIDLGQGGFHYDADQVVSNWAQIYASTDYLYATESANDWWWFWYYPDVEDWTNIHAFDISKKGQTSYVGSGRVPGRIKDTFGLSEKDGNLRVATTTGREWWWIPEGERPTPENHIYVLAPKNGTLMRIGHLGGIANGESIFATRFVGDRAYVVTAKFIDPMFTIDLHDPRHPRLLGELEVPGVSTYIQSIGGGHLLTVGWGGDQSGINESRTQVSLFDVANDAHPARLDTEALDSGGSSWTEALWEHKAFQYWAPKGLLAIPLSSYQATTDVRGYGWSYSTHLVLISVGANGLTRYGDIDHSAFYNKDRYTQWVYTDVRRSIFMGDFIYAISDRGISVHRLADLGMVASAELPGYLPGQQYWWF